MLNDDLNGLTPTYQVIDLGNGYGKVKSVLSSFSGGFVVPSIVSWSKLMMSIERKPVTLIDFVYK